MAIFNPVMPILSEMMKLPGFLNSPMLILGVQDIEKSDIPGVIPDEFKFDTLGELLRARGIRVFELDPFDDRAELGWNLNFPNELSEEFATVLDYGTGEHIFNTATLFSNCMAWLKVGGLYALHVPVRKFYDHGLHTYSSELVPAVFKANNFDIIFEKYTTSSGNQVNVKDDINEDVIGWYVGKKMRAMKTFKCPEQPRYQPPVVSEPPSRLKINPIKHLSMKPQVIIFVADDNYIDHVKSLAVNCREQGKFKGDFAVICPKGSAAATEFRTRYFFVLETELTGFMQKFEVFNDFFRPWKKALYLDCDIIVQDDLKRLFDLLNAEDHHYKGCLWMDTEDGTTMESFWRDKNKEANEAIYTSMEKEFPHVNNQTFNSAFILFHPVSVWARTQKSETADTIPEKLIKIQKQIESINRPEDGGTDQQVINLLLAPFTKKIPDKLVCFWGLAEPQNSGPSVTRGYVGGEIPVAIHYSRWYAPWVAKRPDQDAYLLHHLNIPCNVLYLQNLAKFDSQFAY